MMWVVSVVMLAGDGSAPAVPMPESKDTWRYVVLVDPPLAPSDQPRRRQSVRMVQEPRLRAIRFIALEPASASRPVEKSARLPTR